MGARLSAEQARLRDAAAKLADDLGPHSVLDLAEADRVEYPPGWRRRSPRPAGGRCAPTAPSGVEIALVAEELSRGLVDVPFLGPVLADALGARPGTTLAGAYPCQRARHRDMAPRPGEGPWAGAGAQSSLVGIDARGMSWAIALDGVRLATGALGVAAVGVDLTRQAAPVSRDAGGRRGGLRRSRGPLAGACRGRHGRRAARRGARRARARLRVCPGPQAVRARRSAATRRSRTCSRRGSRSSRGRCPSSATPPGRWTRCRRLMRCGSRGSPRRTAVPRRARCARPRSRYTAESAIPGTAWPMSTCGGSSSRAAVPGPAGGDRRLDYRDSPKPSRSSARGCGSG